MIRSISGRATALLVFTALTVNSAHAELNDGYGVLIGKPTSHGLEAPGLGQWPHYKVKVQTPSGTYDVAINMFSVVQNLGTQVAHRELFMNPANDYRNVYRMSDGWHPLPYHHDANAAGSGALDFLRHSGIIGDITDEAWQQTPLIVDADNNPNTQNAVPQYDQLLATAKRVYIWGEPYTNGLGVHNVHQNQGNTDSFLQANGIWQDGGMIIENEPIVINGYCVRYPCIFPITIPNRVLVMTRFQVQADFSDYNGKGIANPTQQTFAGSGNNSWVSYGPFYGAGQLQVELTNVSGDPDIYSRAVSPPTLQNYSRRSSSNPGLPVFLRDYQPGPVPPQYVSVHANGASSWNIKIRYAP
jgi:hypothetical protein